MPGLRAEGLGARSATGGFKDPWQGSTDNRIPALVEPDEVTAGKLGRCPVPPSPRDRQSEAMRAAPAVTGAALVPR